MSENTSPRKPVPGRVKFLPFIALLLLCLLAAEGTIRAAIFLGADWARNPALYADWYSDDDYWKLQYSWQKKYMPASASRIHHALGWSQGLVTSRNPLGLLNWPQLISNEEKILFYGDSFVRGSSREENQIPVLLRNEIGRSPVVDLSVGGYGFDQIFLLFKRTHGLAGKSVHLIGLLVDDDLDRTALSLRVSQKPYFSLSPSGDLVLQGTPVKKDQAKFFEGHPPEIKSYFFNIAANQIYFFKKIKSAKKESLKKDISSKIIEKIDQISLESGSPLIFVLFYAKNSLGSSGWQENFLKQQLDKRSVHYFDSKASILRSSESSQVPLSDFYAPDGHHNDLGNQVIAKALAAYLKDILPSRLF